MHAPSRLAEEPAVKDGASKQWRMPAPARMLMTLVFLDALAVGAALPTLPMLLREWSDGPAILFGSVSSAYAVLQIASAPFLARMSDRFGARPVLLAAALAAAADYLVCAGTPSLIVLVIARLLAGAFAANGVVWNACIADLADGAERVRLFSHRSAAFGCGIVAGPAIGGLLAEISLRLPFVFAAMSSLTGCFLIRRFEPRMGRRTTHSSQSRSEEAPPRARAALRPLLVVHLAVQIVSQVGVVMWVIHGQERYGWTPLASGLSLGAFGLLNATAQVALTPVLLARMKPWGLLLLTLGIDTVGHVLVGLASKGWMFLAVMPILALAGPAFPALQSVLCDQVDVSRQGALQARLAQLSGLAAIATPLAATTAYNWSAPVLPGLIWFLAAAVYIPAAPFFLRAWKGMEGCAREPDTAEMSRARGA